MKWGTPIPRSLPAPREEWTTNEEIWKHWERFVRSRGAKNTQRNLLMYPAVFFRSFDDLVTELSEADFAQFIERMEVKCSKLQFGKSPACLAGADIEACPLLAGDTPYESCKRYEPLLPSAVWSYVTAVHRLYSWLQAEGRIGLNPATSTYNAFEAKHRDFFDDRMRHPRRRKLTVHEVRHLVGGTPIQWSVGVAIMAKCFLRVHELLKLRLDPMYCNLDEGWMDIPPDWDLGGKRLGNHRIILDSELLHMVRRYLAWREQRVRRDESGVPVTDRFVITHYGLGWGKGAIGNFRTGLQRHCVRLGIMTGQETRREERISTHCFRAFATTEARRRGGSAADVQTMRGDLNPGSLIRYEDYLANLPGLYERYSIRLGI